MQADWQGFREAAHMVAGCTEMPEGLHAVPTVITKQVWAILQGRRELRRRGCPPVPQQTFRRRRRRRRRSPMAFPESNVAWAWPAAGLSIQQDAAWVGPAEGTTFSRTPFPLFPHTSQQAREGTTLGVGAGRGGAHAGSAVLGEDVALVAPRTSSVFAQAFSHASAASLAHVEAPFNSHGVGLAGPAPDEFSPHAVGLSGPAPDQFSSQAEGVGSSTVGGHGGRRAQVQQRSENYIFASPTCAFSPMLAEEADRVPLGAPLPTTAAPALQALLPSQGSTGSSSWSLQASDSPLAGWDGAPEPALRPPFVRANDLLAALKAYRNPSEDSNGAARMDAPPSALTPLTVRPDPSLGGPSDPSGVPGGTRNHSLDDRRAALGSRWSLDGAGPSGLGFGSRVSGFVDQTDDPNWRRKSVRWGGGHASLDEPMPLTSPRAWVERHRSEGHRPATEVRLLVPHFSFIVLTTQLCKAASAGICVVTFNPNARWCTRVRVCVCRHSPQPRCARVTCALLALKLCH